MKFAFKQSHFFAMTAFGLAVVWFGANLAARAAVGAITWSEVPSMLMLAALSSGLIAIAFNFIWLKLLEKSGQPSEEPSDYVPTRGVLNRMGGALVMIALLGAVQGYIEVETSSMCTSRTNSGF